MAADGWVRAHRKVQEHPCWSHDGMFKLLFYCWQEANYKDSAYLVPGTTETVVVARGSFITGREALRDALYPRRTSETPVSRTVYRWLQSLEQMNCVKLQIVSNRCTIVTVVNYDIYNPTQQSQCPADVPPVSSWCPADVPPVSTSEESKEREESKEGNKNADSSEPDVPASKPASKVSPKSSPEPPVGTVLTYPCVGKVSCWHLVDAQIASWQAMYPNLDIQAECRKAWAWVDADSSKRKTAGGMMKYLVSWFNRTTDANRGSNSPRAQPDLFSGQKSWAERRKQNATFNSD